MNAFFANTLEPSKLIEGAEEDVTDCMSTDCRSSREPGFWFSFAVIDLSAASSLKNEEESRSINLLVAAPSASVD